MSRNHGCFANCDAHAEHVLNHSYFIKAYLEPPYTKTPVHLTLSTVSMSTLGARALSDSRKAKLLKLPWCQGDDFGEKS